MFETLLITIGFICVIQIQADKHRKELRKEISKAYKKGYNAGLNEQVVKMCSED